MATPASFKLLHFAALSGHLGMVAPLGVCSHLLARVAADLKDSFGCSKSLKMP